MVLHGTENNETILKEMGRRIADVRIAISLTQEELAARAGVSLRTIERIEKGNSVNVDKILNVLRAVQCLSALEVLVPAQELSPAEFFQGKKKRKRVSAKMKQASRPEWKWGDES